MLKIFQASSGAPRNYFRWELSVLKAFGLSVTGNESFLYKIYSFVIILFFICGYPLVQFINLVKNDFTSDTKSLFYQVGIFVSMMRTFVILCNRSQIRNILSKLQKKPFTPNPKRGGDAEEKLIKECVCITTMQTLVYWIPVFINLTIPTLYSFKIRLKSNDYHDWMFPFGPLNVLNATRSPNYEISWLHQIISLYCIAYHLSTIDLITAAVLCHLCYQFKILRLNLKRIVKNSLRRMHKRTSYVLQIPPNKRSLEDEETDGSRVPWKYLKHSLEEIVEYHLAILDIAEEMENVFSSLLLLIFLGTLTMLCFSVFRLSMLSLNDPEMMKTVLEALNTPMQVLLVCFWGEKVTHESRAVGRAAYEANFVGTDLRFQRALALIIRRSQNPVKLTAGKFTNIGMMTFAWILRSTYSAATMLRNMNMQEP